MRIGLPIYLYVCAPEVFSVFACASDYTLVSVGPKNELVCCIGRFGGSRRGGSANASLLPVR